MKTPMATWLRLALILGGLLASCGTENAVHTIGAPTKTVGQLKEWPEGLVPTGGGFRPVDMPSRARRNLVEASPDAPGSQDYFQTLRP